ncbi:MAG TPA: glycerol-3-phosphate 1-O-acyltransferase PlsY [Candidatus Limnocylindria bacterium]|nr:glycerol-3-phosphate 1-O-acyltransferase PlsY [Candidatus Limnocylindria bacterium]
MDGPLGALGWGVIGYLLGALPFGVIVGRLLGGVDPRTSGSGRTGTTNTLRSVGMPGAVLVLALDIAKGLAAVLLARWIWAGDPAWTDWVAALAGVGAVIGHIWSVFIRFAGGRGVATSTGGLLGMAPWSLVVLGPLVAVIVWRTRYVSLASVAAAVTGPIVVVALFVIGLAPAAAIAYGVAAGLLILFAHVDNIGRLRAGTERKLGQNGPSA